MRARQLPGHRPSFIPQMGKGCGAELREEMLPQRTGRSHSPWKGSFLNQTQGQSGSVSARRPDWFRQQSVSGQNPGLGPSQQSSAHHTTGPGRHCLYRRQRELCQRRRTTGLRCGADRSQPRPSSSQPPAGGWHKSHLIWSNTNAPPEI